jgi:hypothetical protein
MGWVFYIGGIVVRGPTSTPRQSVSISITQRGTATTAVTESLVCATKAAGEDATWIGGRGTFGTKGARLVEDSTMGTFPIVHKTFADLMNGHADSIRGALDLDDSLGGLRKHFLGGNHPHT